ncbi:hypothetical protein GIB67_016426 [Kingdonia uniflora]|uniref:Mon2/Sec7/BIG1-like HUS domain-containing protein n=1 Tax=Kingdonia uniflora TaxID=39325 RepID=A0A7J7MHD3_9MAGN|nr:hypothetical protein GIB67_016426 [Kingdonia uniflora]
MKRRTKVSRLAARYHFPRRCLWLAGIGDDYKVDLQGEVMGKWELVMDDDEMGSQSCHGISPRSNTLTFDEDVPLFTLSLINSAIELGGPSICQHPKLLALIQNEFFRNLMQFGLSMCSLLLSMVCSIVLNLYHHLLMELKLQLEAFFSCEACTKQARGFLPAAGGCHGGSYQFLQTEDRLRWKCMPTWTDINCNNVFEDLSNLLSMSAFPVNCPLSIIRILSLDGLIAVIQGMAERIGNGSAVLEQVPFNFEEYIPFWNVKCEDYADPFQWVSFVHRRKYIKIRLMIDADHFNRDPKKGLEFL